MPLSEADTRAKLIDPALYARGWKEDNLKRVEMTGAVEIVMASCTSWRETLALQVKEQVAGNSQPVAMTFIGAKREYI